MITFKTFLGEQKLDVSPEEAAHLIFENCEYYLEQRNYNGYEHDHLYRGMSGANLGNFSEMTARTNRPPSDSSPYISDILDDFLKKKFGFPFRSAGTFCTPSIREARGYGDPYIIFPIGTFKYVWSPKIQDAYLDFDGGTFGADFEEDMPRVFDKGTRPKKFRDIIDAGNAAEIDWESDPPSPYGLAYKYAMQDYLEHDSGYTDKGLDRVRYSTYPNEVMLGCKTYYLLSCPTGSAGPSQRGLSPEDKALHVAYCEETLEFLADLIANN